MNTFILCLVIFIVRILDTAIGTIRTILTVKGRRFLSMALSFIEAFIWIVIMKEAILNDNSSIVVGISYALGFAVGTYVGMCITDKFIDVDVVVNVFFKKNNDLIDEIIENDFAVSSVDIKGKDVDKEKNMLIIGTSYKKVKLLKKIICKYDKHAYITVSELKKIYNGYYGK